MENNALDLSKPAAPDDSQGSKGIGQTHSQKRKVEPSYVSQSTHPANIRNQQGGENPNLKRPRLEGNSSSFKTFDESEFIFESLERITDELAMIKQYLRDLPQKLAINMSSIVKSEIDSQFQQLSSKLLLEIRRNNPNVSPQHLSEKGSTDRHGQKLEFEVPNGPGNMDPSSAVCSQVPKLSPMHLSPSKTPQQALETMVNLRALNRRFESIGNFPKLNIGFPFQVNSPNIFNPSNMIQNSNKAPVPSTSSASFTDERNKSIVSNTSQVTSQPQTFTSQLVSLAQNQGSSVQQNRGAAPVPTTPKPSEGPSSSGLSSASSSSPPDYHSLSGEMSGPKYIQAPVQIRIEDLHADCNVHKVKILDIIPPLDVFELDDQFMYKIFLKYKYPSIFVQALFVLHYGSFKAMHLNTSSRVKNNLELIPESFVNSLTVLVLNWFPAVDDLDFGKCLNQKQRSILSAARSCLFFKKCDACKQRNIDSLPSTYSVKNLVPLMAAQQHKQVKREAMNASGVNHFRMSHHNTDNSSSDHSGFGSVFGSFPTMVKSETGPIFPSPPLSDSLSPIMDLSDSLTSVFDRVSELVNGTEVPRPVGLKMTNDCTPQKP
ncbi:uncharacterized protein LOC134856168 [Symsagittifera roscoffensis]|uniref:uncharacterized protein LOC134856168 n=1 Tax=Symsagittifera roscoffensis TaxID=84072 RepID=UPI00307CBBBD